MAVNCQEYCSVSNYLSDNINNVINNRIKLFYLNARSFRSINKFELFKQSVSEIQPQIIAVVETWLRKGEHLFYQLPGYSFFEVSRSDKRGGGLGFYFKNSLTVTKILKFMGQYEILHVTLLLSSKKSHFMLVYYPREMFAKIVTEHLEEILSLMREDVFVLCDFNLNLLATEAHVQAYVDMLQSYGIHFMNTTFPTRPASGSLLDHFSTNIP